MRDFLVSLHKNYDRIIESHVGRLVPDLSFDEFMTRYKSAVAAQHRLRKKNDTLLNDYLFPLLNNPASITYEDEADLFLTAQKLSSYSARVDPGLALKIYKHLLSWARFNNDDAMIIKYCYWCGITSFFYFYNRSNDQLDINIVSYFEEGSDYAPRYDSFENPETRQYIHRCLGNKSMMYYRIHGQQAAIKLEEEIFAFWNMLIFNGKDLDFPWLSYFLACLNHRHNDYSRVAYQNLNTLTKAQQQDLLELSIIINKIYNRNRSLYSAFGGTRYDCLLWRSQFLAGLISFDMFRDNIAERAAQFDKDDFSDDAIFTKIQTYQNLINFANTMHSLRDRRDEIIPGLVNEYIRNLSSVPFTVSCTTVADLLKNFAVDIAPLVTPQEQVNLILKLTSSRSIQLHAHCIMVGKLAAFLTSKLIDKDPGCFCGCLGIKSADKAVANKNELVKFAETAGLCHDVGAVMYAANPFLFSRVLTEDEFELVRLHPNDGAEFLQRSDNSELTRNLRDVILGHHKYFDNIGGFPNDFDIDASPVKMIIYIISAASAIDRLTDNIFTYEKSAKSLSQACKTIISDAGRRFSPQIASLLKDSAVFDEIEALLTSQRSQTYYSVYLQAWQ